MGWGFLFGALEEVYLRRRMSFEEQYRGNLNITHLFSIKIIWTMHLHFWCSSHSFFYKMPPQRFEKIPPYHHGWWHNGCGYSKDPRLRIHTTSGQNPPSRCPFRLTIPGIFGDPSNPKTPKPKHQFTMSWESLSYPFPASSSTWMMSQRKLGSMVRINGM